MIHSCNVHCHSMNQEELELLGVDDRGKWLPFSFLLEMVGAIKMASDDENESIYNCTTVFSANGETYIIDTPFHTFEKLWKDYFSEEEESQDLEL
jgi:hypothetical protein